MADQHFKSNSSLKQFILETAPEVSDLLKSIQHPKRLEILAYLVEEQQDFHSLKELTKLPKSALGNHLSELVAKHLIEKVIRGIYQITLDGEQFIASLSQNYLNAKIREQERLDRQRETTRTMISKYTGKDIEYVEIVEKLQIKRSLTEMEIEIREKKKFIVMGIQDRGTSGPDFIPPLWNKFNARFDEIKNLIVTKEAYGVCFASNKASKEFNYLAGFEVNEGEKPLDSMIVFTVPKAQYAVITCTLPKISEAYKSVGKWIRDNGYQEIGNMDMEVYPESWDDEETDLMYIYVPIVKA